MKNLLIVIPIDMMTNECRAIIAHCVARATNKESQTRKTKLEDEDREL